MKTITDLGSVDIPDFKKYPLFAIQIGRDGWKPYYQRGENFVMLGLFGIYISFRRSWDVRAVWKKGVISGFEANFKAIKMLNERVMVREAIIKKMAMISGMKFVSNDPNDPFSPKGVLYGPPSETPDFSEDDDDEDEDDNDSFGFKPGLN